ncbi:MAG: hypothetical protein ABI597_07285 [Gammaproteobacteria bacterium]
MKPGLPKFTENTLIVPEILVESGRLITGLKLSVFWGYIVLSVVVFGVTLLGYLTILSLTSYNVQVPASGTDQAHIDTLFRYDPVNFVVPVFFFFEWFLSSTFTLMALRKSVGLPINFFKQFYHCMQSKYKLTCLFLIWLAVIELDLFIVSFDFARIFSSEFLALLMNMLIDLVCFILVTPLTFFAVPLVLTRRITILNTLKTSFGMMKVHGVAILITYFLFSIIFTISLIPMGAGCFWTIPMYFMMKGIIFRDVYGLKKLPN